MFGGPVPYAIHCVFKTGFRDSSELELKVLRGSCHHSLVNQAIQSR